MIIMRIFDPKAKDIFELYHLNDLSLGNCGKRRYNSAGVYDIIRRSQDSLNKFEQKLGMVKRHFRFKREIKILQSLKEMEPGVSDEYKKTYPEYTIVWLHC